MKRAYHMTRPTRRRLAVTSTDLDVLDHVHCIGCGIIMWLRADDSDPGACKRCHEATGGTLYTRNPTRTFDVRQPHRIKP